MENYDENTYAENLKIQGYLTNEYAIHKNGDVKEKLDRLADVILEQRKQEKIKFWDNFNKKIEYPYIIPNLPTDDDLYHNHVIPALKRCGAIPLDELKKDHFYYGDWRRGNFGKWDGEKFHIWRNKFDQWYLDQANHFEEDDKFALFVPFIEITEEEFNDRELNI